MATRPSWEGHLTFNLVSIPVKAFNAVGATSGKIGFHLLHKGCNERIRYKKVCPVHGEVSNDEIVSGYEYQKGQYVTVEKDAQAWVLVRMPGNDGVRREESIDDQKPVDVHRLMLRATCCEREDLGAAGPYRAGFRRTERCAHPSMLVAPAC